MNLEEYFTADRKEFIKPTPITGERTDWLEFCQFSLHGKTVLIVDAQFVPSSDDGLLVDLSPGNYRVYAKGVNYGGDRRVARLRVVKDGAVPRLGKEVGKTWTDTAKTGFCDFEVFSEAWGSDDDASYEIIEPFFESDHGIAVFDASRGAVMPFVPSGFGDGEFPVFELLHDDQRIGFEIEFIAEEGTSPFEVTPFDKESRTKGIETLAEQGEVESQWQLGKMYLNGVEVGKDPTKAAEWFQRAADGGKAEAANALGLMYESGNGIPKDQAKARKLYEFAAAKGDIHAVVNLGNIYRYGRGVPQELTKAVALYAEAAQKGRAAAQFNLGLCYANGIGVQKDYQEAVKFYRLAAEQGYVGAMCNLGVCIQNGFGTDKDEAEAVKLFKIGAMEGHALCANNLADSFETGRGVAKDLRQAFAWYSVAAGKGVAVAQKSLGVLNKNGESGITKSLELAHKWLGKAAENNNAEAHYELGLLYEAGEGVAADKIEAARRFQKAVAGGFTKAGQRFDELMSTMTETERKSVMMTVEAK